MFICRRSSSPHDDPCENRLDDGKTVTIHLQSTPSIFCSTAVACIKPRGQNRADSNGHLIDLDMIIEYIPWATGSDGQTYSPIWVTNPSEQRVDTKAGKAYFYLQETMMHELGHTLGLYDLALVDGKPHSDYLMGKSDPDDTPHTDIPLPDRNYLRDVYRNHEAR